MQKILITYLASAILLQGMFGSINIFFEISEVIEDYQIHKTNYNDDFATFFSKHFGNLKEQHKEQHQQEHQQHKHPVHNDINTNIVEYVFENNTFNLSVFLEIRNNTSSFFYKNLFSSFEKQKIFQPPKI